MSTLAANQRLLVIVPAFNEEASLANVIVELRAALPGVRVVVINDGSHDATQQVAEGAGTQVVNLPYNLGIGAAMQTGFIVADEEGFDFAVQVDGDGQHDPREIGRLLQPLLDGTADVVVGSRYLAGPGYVSSTMRRTGIRILAACITVLTGQRCTDATSGFRAANRRAIKLCAAYYPPDYPEPESLVVFRQVGLRAQEVPVSMRARTGGKSSITVARSGYYMLKVLLAIGVMMLRRAPRLREV